MAWDKATLRARVEKRAAELRKRLKDVLPKNYPFFAPNKAGSPTIATLETIADNLGWSLCELLCETVPPTAGISPELIKLAVTAAVRAIRSDRAEVIPDATMSALDILQGYEHDRVPIDATALAHIERSLRALYKDR